MSLFSLTQLLTKSDIVYERLTNEPSQTGSLNGKSCKIISTDNKWIEKIRGHHAFMPSTPSFSGKKVGFYEVTHQSINDNPKINDAATLAKQCVRSTLLTFTNMLKYLERRMDKSDLFLTNKLTEMNTLFEKEWGEESRRRMIFHLIGDHEKPLTTPEHRGVHQWTFVMSEVAKLSANEREKCLIYLQSEAFKSFNASLQGTPEGNTLEMLAQSLKNYPK